MAFTSIGAALVHAAVIAPHSDWQAAAMFFAGLAMFQLCWAVLVLVGPPTRGLLALGVAVNAGTLALWSVSRTIGMPFGPERGEPEAFARTDILCAVLEAAIIGATVWLLRTRTAEPVLLRPRHFRLATGATGALVALVSVIALGGAAEHHHGPAEHSAAAHPADGHAGH